MKLTGINKLDTLNKMILLRDGDVPFDVVFLVGSVRDINFAIQLEKEIIGGFVKETAVSEGKGVYFTDLKNSKSILEEHKFKTMDIDVSGLVPSFDYETFILKLGLENVTEDILESLLPEELKEEIKLDIDKVVVNTLMYHYERHDDNLFYEDDFDWFCIKEAPKPVIKEEVPVNVVNEPADVPKREENLSNEEKKSEKKPTHGAGAALLGSYRASSVKKGPVVDPTIVEEEDEDIPLKPEEVIEKKKPAYITKDRLTDEEAAANEEHLKHLRRVYSEGIRFIQETCNSQYRIILNKMQDSLDKNIYKQQFCPMYLEISEDRRSPLYHKLYEIDMATIEFQKKIVHQVIHVGCPFCGKNWDEEITYLTKGPHFVSCPSCFSERGFEKE